MKGKAEEMTCYRVLVPLPTGKDQTLVCNFEAFPLANAIQFCRGLTKHQKSGGYLLQKKFWWIFYRDVKREWFKNNKWIGEAE